jgi:hypothetical protein
MSAQVVAVALSVAGAAIFWASGFFFGRAGRNKARLAAEGTLAELQRWKDELGRAQEDCQRLSEGAASAAERERALKAELQRHAESAGEHERAFLAELQRRASQAADRERALQADLQRQIEHAGERERSLQAELQRRAGQAEERERALKVELQRRAEQGAAREASFARELEEAHRRALASERRSAELAHAQSDARLAQQEALALSQRELGLGSALAKAQSDLASLEAEHRRLEERLRETSAALAEKSERMQELQQTSDDLRAELERRVGSLSAAHHRELALAEERIAMARAELASAKEEAAGLKLVAADSSRLAAELALVLEENRRLSALQFVSRSPVSHALEVRLNETGRPERLALLAAVDKAMEAGSTSAAISDGAGLPVAGAGEHAESLAGFASLFFDLSARASRFLPMRELARAFVEDVNGVALNARALACDDPLLLVTLGVVERPKDEGSAPAEAPAVRG